MVSKIFLVSFCFFDGTGVQNVKKYMEHLLIIKTFIYKDYLKCLLIIPPDIQKTPE